MGKDVYQITVGVVSKVRRSFERGLSSTNKKTLSQHNNLHIILIDGKDTLCYQLIFIFYYLSFNPLN